MKRTDKPLKRGRPATGRGEQINVRLLPDLLSAVDKYQKLVDAQSRPEAIRHVLTDALKRRGLL